MIKSRWWMLGFLATLAMCTAEKCPQAVTVDKRLQVFVLTDITNEPDDSMSLVRLLLHSDQYNITGIVASTSYWLNGTVRPEAILNTTSVWNQVIDNLNVHSAGHFPTKGYLESIVKAGHPVYGTAVFNQTTLSFGAKHLIDVVDGLPKGDILHVQGWGGVQTLAEALKHVRSTRRPRETDDFVRHIRLYTISDQDNAGPWIRLNFSSIHNIDLPFSHNPGTRLALFKCCSSTVAYGARRTSSTNSWSLRLTSTFQFHAETTGLVRAWPKVDSDLSISVYSSSSGVIWCTVLGLFYFQG